mmetsp:Transcript_28673/g.73253  ORF Transcript_28673/g.73253 Transcript_28673/m.73253 type:complete len:142 (-) Transcript_28673:6-431(-)
MAPAHSLARTLLIFAFLLFLTQPRSRTVAPSHPSPHTPFGGIARCSRLAGQEEATAFLTLSAARSTYSSFMLLALGIRYPLWYLIKEEEYEAASRMINRDEGINDSSDSEKTPLHHAAIKGASRIVRQLLGRRARVNVKDF